MRPRLLAPRVLALIALAGGCHSASSAPGAGGAGAGGGGPDPRFGSAGYGLGDVAQQPCDGGAPETGTILDMPWPNPSNVGHDGPENSALHFHWTGALHNVVQVASWQDYWHPDPSYADPGFPRGFTSGPKTETGDVTLSYGAFACGYRPGIYFFVDEDDPSGGIVSSALTVTPDPTTETAAYYAPRPCSALSDPTVYGGRYYAFASRPGCTVFEVNNFQTVAHYDWLPDTFHTQGVTQGDIVLYRWTGFHNVVQVHDATQDAALAGGITSGAKSECVGGPAYACANGPPIVGEYLVDTAGYRPGLLHFSDEHAIHDPTTQACWNPGCTGMNQEFMLAHAPPISPTSCCTLPGASGKYSASCQVIDVYNDGAGSQWSPYQIPAGGDDVVRFRWAGTIKLYQVDPTTKMPKAGGFGMSSPVECVPGPNLSCLNGTTAEAEFLVDIAAALASGVYEKDMYGNITWPVHAEGEGTPGFTSADSDAILFPTSASDPSAPRCP
jgi:hypothetical protein